ncbi:uncharacterized protein LOC122009131 [Zingiber officinale]|uniref:uncharacterized protein LOC122009131 n=1 Tax=Zingiber officinale TaxID=94328 RepID=UPI001C4B0EF4|nr:uncharacterized protein LOC122009131 [Zingiber officinale]
MEGGLGCFGFFPASAANSNHGELSSFSHTPRPAPTTAAGRSPPLLLYSPSPSVITSSSRRRCRTDGPPLFSLSPLRHQRRSPISSSSRPAASTAVGPLLPRRCRRRLPPPLLSFLPSRRCSSLSSPLAGATSDPSPSSFRRSQLPAGSFLSSSRSWPSSAQHCRRKLIHLAAPSVAGRRHPQTGNISLRRLTMSSRPSSSLVFRFCSTFGFASSDPALHPDRASSTLPGHDNSSSVPSEGAPWVRASKGSWTRSNQITFGLDSKAKRGDQAVDQFGPSVEDRRDLGHPLKIWSIRPKGE